MSKCGVIYKILCKDTGRFYVGSTDNLARRMKEHERRHNNCSSKIIIQNGNYEEIVLGLFLYEKKAELIKEEGKYIRRCFYNPMCVNKKMEGEEFEDIYMLFIELERRKNEDFSKTKMKTFLQENNKCKLNQLLKRN